MANISILSSNLAMRCHMFALFQKSSPQNQNHPSYATSNSLPSTSQVKISTHPFGTDIKNSFCAPSTKLATLNQLVFCFSPFP
jgi:hypothetical protein